MHLSYGPGKISCTVCPLHAGCMTRSVFSLAYFTTVVIYECKMLMKSTPEVQRFQHRGFQILSRSVASVIKLFCHDLRFDEIS